MVSEATLEPHEEEKGFLPYRLRPWLAVIGLMSLPGSGAESRSTWTGWHGDRRPPAFPSRSRYSTLRAGYDGDGSPGPGGWRAANSPDAPPVPPSAFAVPEALPKGPVNPSTRSVPVLRLHATGTAVETTISRQQLVAELGCPLRDLRVADPSFPGQFPSVLARSGAIIFAVTNVKAIIRANELLLFPTTPEVLTIVRAVQEKVVQGGAGDVSTGEEVPFEQIALECCLSFVTQSLNESVRDLEPRLRKLLDSFKTEQDPFQSLLHRLLPLKNEMDELSQTIVEVCKCMNEILLNDEDMSLMYLAWGERSGGEARDTQQHQEIEMLFENYLLQVEVLASDLRDYQNEVRNTEEIVEIELDVSRNKILRFELLLSISAFMVSLGALVTGVFGMNLLSGWELQPHTFWIVTGAIYGFMFLSTASTVAFCRRLKLL